MKAEPQTKAAKIPVTVQSLLAALALLLCISSSTKAQSTAAAEEQYQRAVAMRDALESEAQQDRTIDEYKACVAAFRKVYLISPQAEAVTPALVAAAELYQAMGKQFSPQYYDSAIVTYDFLLREYPNTRFKADALFTIAQIQQQNLSRLDQAEDTFKDFLSRYPASDKAAEARAALQQIAHLRDASAKISQEPGGPPVMEEGGRDEGASQITDIRSWNAENYTRIVVDLQNEVKYESARIMNPERIYFDLYHATVSPTLAGKRVGVDNGFLKAIRIAQNKNGVVRIVLDVQSVKEYSAFLLPNPYRLVIDVHGNSAERTNTSIARNVDGVGSSGSTQLTSTAPVADVPNGATPPPAKTPPSNSPTLAVADTNIAPALPKPMARLPVRRIPEDAGSLAEVNPTTRNGEHSLTRVLGLKINRIVIDPGHGGHDFGTIGPRGLAEKDLCLDVALRLGKLIQDRLPGAQVTYTRSDDTFIPLEERTAIANQAKADLFISIHANSSPDANARGTETYYLNFATSPEAMNVATRENAESGASIHDLQGMIEKIARNEKVEESRELAGDIQDSLSKRLQQVSLAERSRGVKKAPFVVLIGADMPSVLTEISFLSNPADEKLLRRPDQRQRIAEGLFRGVSIYLASLNSIMNNQQKVVSTQPPSSLASGSNPK